MIINGKYKFIFLKTTKTAGTSVEIALSKFCSDGDVITEISPEDELVRRNLGYRGPQHYLNSDGSFRFQNHYTAKYIKKTVQSKIWNQFQKISIIRNPYTRIVSAFHYNGGEEKYGSLINFMRARPEIFSRNWRIVTVNNKIVLDHVVRFENLSEGLRVLGQSLGFQEDLAALVASIKTKTDHSKGKKTALDYYAEDQKAKQLVEWMCEHELRSFGYSFDDLR